MVIDCLIVSNYRSFDSCVVDVGELLAIVGRNNSGKSNLLEALNLFIEGSTSSLSEDCFHHHDLTSPAKIRVRFEALSEWEKEELAEWLYDDDTLIVERECTSAEGDSFNIDTKVFLREPRPDWLRKSVISGKKIKQWWEDRGALKVAGHDFGAELGTSRPNVGEWKDAAAEFVEEHRQDIPFEQVIETNPSGVKSALKRTLPEFVLVPAVRDVSEASKITKSSPFGNLVNSILTEVEDAKKQAVAQKIEEVESLLNRGEDRISAIGDVETQLNSLVSEIADVDVEIAMSVPDLEDVLGTAQIFAHDGARTPIEDKGHGLQRSMIFTILRAYAAISTAKDDEEQQNSRTTVFAFEEPEIYQHPQLQRTLLSIFREIAEAGDQVLFTTHSSHFVDISRFDEVCIMRKDKSGTAHCSQPAQLGMGQMLDDLEARKGVSGTAQGMREQYAHAFDSGISEGFFADKVVLVEGPSEQYILPIYARLMGYDFDRNNVAVVHGGGKGQLDRLLRVFSGFDIPTYLIFDGDKNNNDSEITNKTEELLSLLDHDLNSMDDLEDTIASTFAVWGEKIEVVLQDEIDRYDEWASDASQQWGPVGKPLKHRYMAVQIENQVQEDGAAPDEHVPQSIQEVVGRVKDIETSSDVLVEP